MPTLLRTGPYTFLIVLHDCAERRHVHVRGGGRGEGKYWLDPLVEQAATRGYTGRELARIDRAIRDHRGSLIRRWNEICEGETT
ncbi:MAG TPA: DUF4160 domain-containing protein [Terriglobales bacterium]|nr:DUF4160 domain-containing protein [Terriglobales bacterium]